MDEAMNFYYFAFEYFVDLEPRLLANKSRHDA
jgi:hypothetical protein